MQIRYDFVDGMDLSLFKLQGAKHLKKFKDLEYSIFLNNFLLEFNIKSDSFCHNIEIKFSDLIRKNDNLNKQCICPNEDDRFDGLTKITNYFKINSDKGYTTFSIRDSEEVVHFIAEIIKMFFTMNKLLIFT